MIGIEAGIDLLQAREALDQQSSTDEQHKCQRDFRNYQQAAQTLLTRTGTAAAPALFQSIVEIEPRGLQCRCDAEDETSQTGDREGKEQHARIDFDLVKARHIILTNYTEDKLRAPHREQQSSNPAQHRESHALGEQLA